MSQNSRFLFGNKKYLILILSILLICLGFVLMIGGGGVGDSDFNPEIFSSQRIIIAPIVVIIGYIGMVFSIFYND